MDNEEMSKDELQAVLTEWAASPDGFRRWLESRREKETVGFACQAGLCPLAEHLLSVLEQHGISEPFVRVGMYHVFAYSGQEECGEIPPSAWIKRFIKSIDKDQERGAPLTREFVLDCLDRVCPP